MIDELKERARSDAYEAGRKGDVDGAVRAVLSMVSAVDDRVAQVEDVEFGLVQRVEVVERALAALPNAKDLEAVHTVMFGNPQLGVLGLQVLMGQMQAAVRRLDRAIWVLLGMMGLLVAMSLAMVVLWVVG